jgi:hypothetical protein
VIPELNPADINATGAYALAMALAMISFGIGAILRFLPLRTWKSEGRDLMRTAFEAVLLGSSILTANFIINYVKGHLGIPDWKSLLEVIDKLIVAGWESLNQVAFLALIFGAIVGVLDFLSKIVPVIMTFVMHFFMAVSFSVLSFFAALSVILVVLSSAVKMAAALAAHAYLLIAAGIALFGWKHTRALGISLLVFGIASFYGLPVILGFVKPAVPYTTDPDEEARAKILLALTDSSVPTKITVVSGGGKPLFFSYVKMNSSVPVTDVPLNSTLIANITGGPPRNGRGNVTFPFEYGRFYSEGYGRIIVCTPNIDPNYPEENVCVDFGPDYSKVKELRHQLYRNSTVKYVWYLGLFLPVRDNRVQVEGPSLMKPLIEIPSNPFEIAGSLYRAFGGMRSEDEYWEMVYGRSKPVKLEVPVVRELNANVTAFVLYDETPVIKNNVSWPKYVAWREIPGRREYEHGYKIPKKYDYCVVTRTETYFDPSCNCTRTRYYYKRIVVYHYETWDNYIPGDPMPGPKNDRLIAYVLPWTEVVPKVLRYYDDGPPGKSIVVPTVSATVNGSRAKEKGLILDYGPLRLKFNQGINRTKEIPEPTNKAADEVKGNPGKGSGTERELSEPREEVVLYPPGEFWLIGISHTKIIESEEQADSCPTLDAPPEIGGGAILGFDVKNAEPWDPSPLFYWKEYGKTGEYAYIPPRSYDKPPALGAYKPSDPKLAHRFYEEDPREPETNLKKYDVPLIMRFADPISQLSLIGFAFIITYAAADAVTMWLGGRSLGLTAVAGIIAGKLGPGMKLQSPFSLSRYPFFGKDMGKKAMKRLEDRIWGDVRAKLRQKEWEAKNRGDLATLRTIRDFYDIDRKARRVQLVKRLANALGGRNTWWALNKLSGGRLERHVDNLERRRHEILSRIMPDEAVVLQQLSRMKDEKRLTREEARQILSMIKDQAKAQLKWAWPLAFLGLLAHKEGMVTYRSLVFGRLGGKVPAAWAMFGYKMPMAQEKLGINWIKVGEKEEGGKKKPIGIPFPAMKAQLLGPGLSYYITKEKVALERKVVGPDELKAELEKRLMEIREKAKQEGREVKDPIGELLKHPSFRELSRSQIEEVLEGRGHGQYPIWHAIPVYRYIAPEEDGKVRIDYEVTHSRLDIDNRVPGSEPEITIWRKEAGDEIKIDGTMIDPTEKFSLFSHHSPFSSPEEEKQAEEKFREMVREKTRGLGDDWAWYGEITEARWIDSRVDRETKAQAPSGESDKGSEGTRPGDRSKDLWGDGE